MRNTSTTHGVKHICANTACVTRFYDMNHSPAACPKCGLKIPEAVKKPAARRSRASRE